MIKLFYPKEFEDEQNSRGMWIELTSPSSDEVNQIAGLLNLELSDITAAVDLNEKNRIEINDRYSLIVIDTPSKVGDHNYKTLPLGIIMVGTNIVTVCSEDNPILNYLHDDYEAKFSGVRKVALLYEIIFKTTLAFQSALISVNKRRAELESHIEGATNESDLIDLHKLESTLVYFETSIRGNAGILNKLARCLLPQQVSNDREILDDIIIENQQAVEMVQVYRDIVDSTRELMSSVIDSRLNNVMKRLTSITVILSIPTIISGMYGMNLNQDGMPFSKLTYGFGIVSFLAIAICLVLIFLLKRKKLL